MGRPAIVALAEEDAALKTGVGAHGFGFLTLGGDGSDGLNGCLSPCGWGSGGLAVVAGDAVGDEPVGGAAIHIEPFARLVGLARVGVRAESERWKSWGSSFG